MPTASITAAVLTHNEAEMIGGCLRSVQWCDQLLVVDHDSTDTTALLARQMGAKVLSSHSRSFAQRRDELLAVCQTDWIFYIDADERVTPELASEIQKAIEHVDTTALSFPRRNFFFGRDFLHGGWQQELITRVFAVKKLTGWQGDIHESPVFSGDTVQLSQPLWHFSHRSVADGLVKTASWTPMEAELLAKATTQRVSIWTILRKGLGEIWRRGIRQAGWKDGEAGQIEVLTQAINRMLVYMQVWEKQQQHSTSSRYQQLEQEIDALWQKKR